MNDFVNPQRRGVDLPPGIKDLADVLAAKGNFPGAALPAAVKIERVEDGLRQVNRLLIRFLDSKIKDSLLLFMIKRDHLFSLARSGESFKAQVTFSAGDLVLERTMRKILGAMPVYSTTKEPRVYSFRIGVPALGLVMKVLRAYGISETDELTFLLRA